MKSFQCTIHNKDIVYYCHDQHCEMRCLCTECEHDHEKITV